MSRTFSRFGCLLVLASVTLAFGDEPSSPTENSAKPGERLKKLRGDSKEKADLSKLKRLTWKVGDSTREALVYVPEASEKNKNPPLVFAFHGHGGKAEYSARKLAFHESWPEAVCVYPQGLPTPVPVIDTKGRMPGWQKFVGDQKDRDLEFYDVMLKAMKADYKIDENRVYSVGHSNGGFFTYVLWAARGDTLTAVAPIAATLDVRDVKNQKPKPVFHVAGEKDPLVKFQGQELTMQQDRKINGCDPEGKASGKFCTEYTSKNGPPVVTFIHPGGHEIPADAVAKIAEFFKKQSKK